ncbi:MAG: hypothetical protein ABJQ69_03555 [Ekhidna sp.]
MNRNTLKIAGTMAGIGLGISVYVVWDKKRKDKLASEILKQLTSLIKPFTSGLLSESAFDIHYKEAVLQKVNARVLTIRTDTAAKYADQIHQAWAGWWRGGDDENKVYAVFRKLKDKVQVSQVAKAYQDSFQVNLIDKLHERLDEKEIKKILAITRNLPGYRTHG